MKHLAFLVLAIALALSGTAGCKPAPGGSGGAGDSAGGSGSGAATPAAEGQKAPPADPSRQLLVLGRSVMTGWMAHWGGDASTPAQWEGYTVTFREIGGPPDIADSAVAAINEAPAGSTVLFKFCFVDFNGGDYANELAAYDGHLKRIADAAKARDVVLVLGTALPKVPGETTPQLVAEHREFGERVSTLAEQRTIAGQDVRVLDLNGALTAPDGSLRSGYEAAPGDSHLSEAAYDALDGVLVTVLAEVPQP